MKDIEIEPNDKLKSREWPEFQGSSWMVEQANRDSNQVTSSFCFEILRLLVFLFGLTPTAFNGNRNPGCAPPAPLADTSSISSLLSSPRRRAKRGWSVRFFCFFLQWGSGVPHGPGSDPDPFTIKIFNGLISDSAFNS